MVVEASGRDGCLCELSRVEHGRHLAVMKGSVKLCVYIHRACSVKAVELARALGH